MLEAPTLNSIFVPRTHPNSSILAAFGTRDINCLRDTFVERDAVILLSQALLFFRLSLYFFGCLGRKECFPLGN